MPDLALDLRYLRYAFVVAEQGSFRAAAESLGISQSTVSRRVAHLEHRVGVLLFDRDRTGARLTAAGERFIRAAEVGADHLRQAILDSKTTHRTECGELRVGVMTSLASGFVAELLDAYRASYPMVDLRIEEMSWHLASANVLDARADVAFAVIEPKVPGCCVMKLWQEQIVVAVPSNHRLADRISVSWDDLSSETFLIPDDVTGSDIEKYIRGRNSSNRVQPRMSPHGLAREGLLALVRRGFGILLTLESSAGVGDGSLVFLKLSDTRQNVQFCALWMAKNRKSALQSLLQMAKARAGGDGCKPNTACLGGVSHSKLRLACSSRAACQCSTSTARR